MGHRSDGICHRACSAWGTRSITHFDLDKHFVYGVTPDGRKLHRRYDTLVVAGGATHAYFGNDHWADFAPGMKTLGVNAVDGRSVSSALWCALAYSTSRSMR